MKDKTNLGQYYTKAQISSYILKLSGLQENSKVIDLCAGTGSLVRPINDNIKNINLTLCDVDKNNINHLNNSFSEHSIIEMDTTSLEATKMFLKETKLYHLALCNPPFTRIENKHLILKKMKYITNKRDKYIRAEIFYLIFNLNILKKNGKLIIILPDIILTGEKHIVFRSYLFEKFNVSLITELYSGAFESTEAKCHLLVIKNNKPISNNIKINKLSSNGDLHKTIIIPTKNAINRSDYSYHCALQIQNKKTSSLETFGAEIARGSLCKSKYTEQGVNVFHTDSFKDQEIKKYCLNSPLKYKVANKGDILIPRVGKRCLNQVRMVNHNGIIFSDSVFRIRVNKKYHALILNGLQSSTGKEAIFALSKGIAARFLPKKELLNAQIF